MSVTTFADPYKTCNRCGGWVTGYIEQPGPLPLTPCGHATGYTDVCPSWSPVGGCRCLVHFGSVLHSEPTP